MPSPLGDPLVCRPPEWLALEVTPSTETDLTEAIIAELFALASSMAEEDYDHFRKHLRTNTSLHRFRDTRTGALAGFQLWRLIEDRSEPIILGGKLRILPPYRRRGLHLLSGLRFFADLSGPGGRRRWGMLRLSVASLFGFASIAKNLADWRFIGPDDRDLLPLVEELASESGYAVNRATGQIDVGFTLTDAQVRAYPADFYESQLARAYIARSPTWQRGSFLSFTYRMTPANCDALRRGAEARLGARPERASA